jgi:hypothetical protein
VYISQATLVVIIPKKQVIKPGKRMKNILGKRMKISQAKE